MLTRPRKRPAPAAPDLRWRTWPIDDRPLVAKRAKIQIAGQTSELVVNAGDKGVVFELDLPAGKTKLHTWLYDEAGAAGGAYFAEVEAL